MKKILCLLLALLILSLLALSAMAASEEPVITMQPQSPNYPEYSVAIYTVKVTGTNLSATWYMQWQGSTYTISSIGGAMQPWEAYAGESYGARKVDSNTFSFIFEGIQADLDGAYIWCVIEDGHYSVASQKTRISVGNPNTPPEILSIPSQITVEQGDYAEIRCVARSNSDAQLSFLWYESDTGRIEDIRAVNRGTETSDYLICDTAYPGTRNYICFISTSNGGFANSSFVTVTVTPKTQSAPQPDILTTYLPDATVGTQYAFQLQCADPNAEFFPYYNPGGKNELEQSGIGLRADGWLRGTPTTPGSYTFCVCTAGAGGEDYREFTLNVVQAALSETTAPTTPPPEATAPPATTPDAAEPSANTPVTTDPAPSQTVSPDAPQEPAKESSGLPWWTLAVAGYLAALIGAGVAILLVKAKKSK